MTTTEEHKLHRLREHLLMGIGALIVAAAFTLFIMFHITGTGWNTVRFILTTLMLGGFGYLLGAFK